MTLLNIPDSPEEITEEELVTALTAMNLVDNVTSIDDLSELHFSPGELEVVYVRQVRSGAYPLLVHRRIRIRAGAKVQDS